MTHFIRTVVLAVSMLFGLSAQAANPAAAKNFLDAIAAQVLVIVKDDKLSQTDRQAKIENLFADKVDISFVAKFALGKHWRAATPEQQKEYIAAYRPFILKNYGGKLTKYSGQTYALKNTRIDGEAIVVTMEIDDPNGQKIMMDYRLRDDGATFKITDIAVEGVSLLTTQRSEFNGIIEGKGIDGLIAALKQQVAAKG